MSAEVALNGVREETRVGQRTTVDVVNARQPLVNARVVRVTAQHDRLVASDNVPLWAGSLLGFSVCPPLQVDPMVYYQHVGMLG
jgi:outer membrane protein